MERDAELSREIPRNTEEYSNIEIPDRMGQQVGAAGLWPKV